MGFHGAGAARAEERGPAAGTMIGEWRWLLAAVWSRLRDDGLGTAPVTLCLLAGIALLAALQFLGVGQPLVTACCAPAAHQPWWQALARLPGSTVAPAQSLPASGALLQVLLVVGAAEMLIGSRAVVAVGLAAQCATTAAARLMSVPFPRWGWIGSPPASGTPARPPAWSPWACTRRAGCGFPGCWPWWWPP